MCSILAPATHLIIVSVLQAYNFDMLYKRLFINFFLVCSMIEEFLSSNTDSWKFENL